MSTNNDGFRSNFGLRLKQARKSADMNQTAFASWVGITRDTVSRYERGELTPPVDVLRNMLSALGPNVTADWLLFGSQEPSNLRKAILLKNFGSLIRLGFQGQGTADVSMGFPEVVRIMEGCIEYELKSENSNEKAIKMLRTLIEHYYDDGSDIELLANVVIAQHAVRLVPEWPQETEEEKEKFKTTHKALVEEFESNTVKQQVSGNDNKIAGRDISNKEKLKS